MARINVRNFGSSLSFTGGTSNRVTAPYTFPTDAFSVCFWHKQKATMQSNETLFNQAGSFSLGRQGTNDVQIYAYLNAPNDFAGLRRLRFRNFCFGGTTQTSGSNLGQVSMQWQFRVYVVYVENDSAKCDEYINGVKIGSTHTVDYTGDATTPSGNLAIGNSISSSIPTNGLMANVTIINKRISADDVLKMYQNGLNKSDSLYASVGARWRMDEGSGTTAKDESGNGNDGTISGATYSLDVPIVSRSMVTSRKNASTDILRDYNGDFNSVPSSNTSATTTDGRWVDGTSGGSSSVTAQKWFFNYSAGTVTGSAQYDTTNLYNGKPSMKIVVLSTAVTSVNAGVGVFMSQAVSPSSATQKAILIPCRPNTRYKMSGYIKTDSITGSNGARARMLSYSGTGSGSLASASTSYFSGTNDWTYFEIYMDTTTTSAFINPWLHIDTTGSTIGTAWFAGVKIEEQFPFSARKRIDANMVTNGNFDYFPAISVATTTTPRWIEGSAGGSTTNDTFRWYYTQRTGSGTSSAQFDPANNRSGVLNPNSSALKLAVTANTGQTAVRQTKLSGSGWATDTHYINVLPNTSYKASGWMKTSGVGASGGADDITMMVAEVTGAFTFVTTRYLVKNVTTTTDWTYYEVVFTTGSTTRYLDFMLIFDTITGTAWIDDIKIEPMTPVARLTA